MSNDQKFLRVVATDSDGKEIDRFEIWVIRPSSWTGYDTKYVTEGSPDRISDLMESVSQWARKIALSGNDGQISIRVCDSQKEAQ